MTHLSNCCKAEIRITGEARPNSFACLRCGRIIETPAKDTHKDCISKSEVEEIIIAISYARERIKMGNDSFSTTKLIYENLDKLTILLKK